MYVIIKLFSFQELHTPRSNRSVDSGLPHDDITPRSESLSTASSASPPDQSQHGHHHNPQSHSQLSREMQQQHRKSTSLDDINLNFQGFSNRRIIPTCSFTK